jgi:hypothetical protein
MNKKTAFTVVVRLSVKMGFIKVFSVINAPDAVSDLQEENGCNRL